MTRMPALRQYPTCLDLPEDAPRTRRAWAGGFPDGCLAVGSPISPKLATTPEIDNVWESARYILSSFVAVRTLTPSLGSRQGAGFLFLICQPVLIGQEAKLGKLVVAVEQA